MSYNTGGQMMEVQVGVAKVGKYATSESGDTFEMVERPHGGLSFVLADGQRSGRAAKAISHIVARKAISLLAEGVRDGAAARATHDYLYTQRQGQVQATLNIVSVDLQTRTIVLSRNNPCPVIVADEEGVRLLDEPCQPLGIYSRTKPVITEIDITPNTYIVVFTDGIYTAGERYGEKMDVAKMVGDFLQGEKGGAQALAEEILNQAISLERGRPSDDLSVLVVAIVPRTREDDIRRMAVSFPI